jgi:hypothetical protein
MRGSLDCARRRRWLACTWTHATNLHMNEGWFVDLRTRRVHAMDPPLPGEMAADGAFFERLGAPAWEGDRVVLRFRDPDAVVRVLERSPPLW